MKWGQTGASECRWAEYAAIALGINEPDLRDHEILWSIGESDYQGSADVLLRTRTASEWDWDREHALYKMIAWSYGSCSGCDGKEGEPFEKVLAEFCAAVVTFKDKDELRKFGEGLEAEYKPDAWWGGAENALKKINAIRTECGLVPLAEPQDKEA